MQDELWNEVIDMFNNSKRKIHIYEGLETVGRLELEKVGIMHNSVLGTIILHTAGIRVDNWIRIIGQNCDEHNGIFQYNSANNSSENEIMQGMFIVAQDIVGGVFAINVSKFSEGIKMIWYFAPDTLEWECLDMNYAQFLAWTIQGNLDEFYSSMRWDYWEKDCKNVGFDKVWLIYPFLWSQECELETASKKLVPFMELKELNTDYAKRFSNL